MATLARRRAERAPVLVVCPSAALVEQLQSEFATGFWDKVGADAAWRFQQVPRLTLTEIDTVLEIIAQASEQCVAVFATIQALQQIHSSPRYGELIGQFGTVFFDEGHREPAPQWARAARGFGVPTVLFSATLYRNDLKLFDVDEGFISFLSFHEASPDGFIRPVEIEEVAFPLSPVHFAHALVARRDQLIAAGQVQREHKMIVRAGTEQQVEDLYSSFIDVLRARGESVLAIHNNLNSAERAVRIQMRASPRRCAG
jgi:superfamily II DNA or RNA helicase